MGLFARASGLTKLAERYPATHVPAGTFRTKQTVQIGIVRYRRCVTVGIGPEGLYLEVRPPLGRHAQLQLPWEALKPAGAAPVFGRRGMRLTLGDPQVGEIRVYRELFALIQPYLRERD